MFGGSWYIRTNQPTLTNRQTWNINEAQYLRQTPTSDYVVGSQPTFWRNQGGYDKSMLGLGELFYQPANFPLEVAFSGLLGTDDGLEYNANIRFRPSNNFDLNFNSDRLSQRFRANYRAFKGISFRASGNTRENTLAAGFSYSRSSRNFFTSISADIDTNNNFRWNLSSRLGKLQLRNSGNEIATNSQLSYNFSKTSSTGNSLNLINYETSRENNLASLNWKYRSKSRNRYGRSLFDFDLGYGIGTQGSGIIASASTGIIPGMDLRLRYQGISATSNSNSFRIELSPSFYIQPKLSLGDNRYEGLRGEGGLFIQPFLDKNGNGKLDKKEKIYTEDLELLLSLNNKSIKRFRPDINGNGVLIQTAPDNYRLDLDPAGYPIDWKPTQTAYAVEVAAGGFTQILLPFIPSYTVAGTVTNAEGKPVGGARVEAVVTDKKGKVKKIMSVTNGAGIFFLENLQQGNYKLLINDKTAKPGEIVIDEKSETIQEVELKI